MALYVTPPQPKYLLCKDWFKEEFYLQNQEDNPYWQYLHIKDALNTSTKLWETKVTIDRKIKNASKNKMKWVEVPNSTKYVIPHKGYTYIESLTAMTFEPCNAVNHSTGEIILLLESNTAYNAVDTELMDKNNRQYGIAITSHFTDQNQFPTIPNYLGETMFAEDHAVVTHIDGMMSANYTINSTKNFADLSDDKSAVVAVTELGVFNTDGAMMAYATFPPIIYNSARHHLSCNLFIKKEAFPIE